MTTERREIAFIISARDKATGQFKRVEEATGGLADKFLFLTGTLAGMLPLLGKATTRLRGAGTTIRRLGGAFLAFAGANKLVLLGLAAVPFAIGKIVGALRGGEEEFASITLANRRFEAALVATADKAPAEAARIAEALESTLGRELFADISLETFEKLARIADDPDLVAALGAAAKQMSVVLGIPIDAALLRMVDLFETQGPDAIQKWIEATEVGLTATENLEIELRNLQDRLPLVGQTFEQLGASIELFFVSALNNVLDLIGPEGDLVGATSRLFNRLTGFGDPVGGLRRRFPEGILATGIGTAIQRVRGNRGPLLSERSRLITAGGNIPGPNEASTPLDITLVLDREVLARFNINEIRDFIKFRAGSVPGAVGDGL